MIGRTIEVRRHLINRAEATIDIVDSEGRLLCGEIVAVEGTHVIANVWRPGGPWLAVWLVELPDGRAQFREVDCDEVFPGTTERVRPVGRGTMWVGIGERVR